MKKFIACIATLTLLLGFLIGSVCGALATISKKTAIDNAKYCSDRIGDKVEETLDLLVALSNTDIFQGDEISYRDKAASLTKISKQFGYMMIRVLDADLRVYNENSTNDNAVSSDLSNRDYLQELKKTLTPQVTDAFLAGADGRTVNFTIAVPIIKDEDFKGALFAAIYEADFAKLLSENNAVLLGSKLQYMSGVDVEEVGTLLIDDLETVWLPGSTVEKRLLEIRNSGDSHFKGIRKGKSTIYAYNSVENTSWNVISKVTYADSIDENALMFAMVIVSIAATLFVMSLAISHKSFFIEEEASRKAKEMTREE